MNFTTFFSRQARKPTGLFGRWIMSSIFDFGNKPLNRFVYSVMAPQGGDHILDVGCGTGKLIGRIARQTAGCVVEGIDFSASMVAIARRKNGKHIATGKVRIHEGTMDHLRVPVGTFTKICSVNTIYFWPAPESTIKKMVQLLKPGGMLVLGYEDIAQLKKRRLDAGIFRLYSKAEVETLVRNTGSASDVVTQSMGIGLSVFHCTVATRKKEQSDDCDAS
jgi:ubiquinone/menaquinone biosynthesis C-methylase UbiE